MKKLQSLICFPGALGGDEEGEENDDENLMEDEVDKFLHLKVPSICQLKRPPFYSFFQLLV